VTTDGILRAEDEARTRDLNLGKVALYQLSYFRNSKELPFASPYPTDSQLSISQWGCKNKAMGDPRKIFFNAIYTAGYTTYFREPQPPVYPYNDAYIIRRRRLPKKR
jgi:hypothetical protein